MQNNSWKRLLVLAPHTDDAELGCGGTIVRCRESGVEVHVVAFSTAEESLPPGSVPYQLKDEFMKAVAHLNVPVSHTYVYDYPVRKLSYHRQEVLEEMIRLKELIRPDVVFIPSGSDLHQDHQVVHAEGIRAFKDVTLWGYELPWNHITFQTNAFVILQKRHMEVKWTALQAYKSQLELNRPYFTREFLEGLARVRGVQVKADYAEAFEVIRIRM